jgi:hypothetical protein
MNDLVLGVKVDTSIIEIHGEFCFAKCGSGSSVYHAFRKLSINTGKHAVRSPQMTICPTNKDGGLLKKIVGCSVGQN